MAAADGSDEGRFDRDEGCRVEVFGELLFGGVVVNNSVGLVWMVTC